MVKILKRSWNGKNLWLVIEKENIYEPSLMLSKNSPLREKYNGRIFFDCDDFRADRLEICGGGVYKAIATTNEGDQFEFRFVKRKLKGFDIRAF